MHPVMKRLALLAMGAALSGGAAQAQDWSGLYAGGYLASTYSGSETAYGARLGYNMQSGNLVYGGELDGFKSSSGVSELFANLRGGYALGDKALVFASIGSGRFSLGDTLKSVGIGGEYMLSDNLSMRIDYEKHNVLSQPVFNGPGFAKLGISWNF